MELVAGYAVAMGLWAASMWWRPSLWPKLDYTPSLAVSREGDLLVWLNS